MPKSLYIRALHVLLIGMLSLTAVFTTSIVAAQTQALNSIFDDEPQFLKVDEAFNMDFSQKNGQLSVNWSIADGYYLYKKQFKTVTKNATIGEPNYSPAPTQIEDEFFGISDVFFNHVDVTYPIIESITDGVVKIRFQGCAEAGLCYPPTTKVIYLSAVTNNEQSSAAQFAASSIASDMPASSSSEQYKLLDILLADGNLGYKLALFLNMD